MQFPAPSAWRGLLLFALYNPARLHGERNGVPSKAASGKNSDFGLTPAELRAFRALKTPEKIQRFLDDLPYHHADTAWSPRKVLRERTGHCLEGALLAAAALRVNGYPPLLFDLEAVRDDDHVLAIYQYKKHFGSIAKSNYSGLRFRAPVYRNLRELALSYFEDYFNLRGERSLRGYSRMVNLSRFDKQEWMTSEKSVWCVPEYLLTCRHYELVPPPLTNNLPRLDRRSFEAGLHGRQAH